MEKEKIMLPSGKQAPKILVRSPNWVGDAVMATPVPRALKKAMPNCRIHILAKPWVAPLWERHPDVERVIVMKQGGLGPWVSLILALRHERYDLGILLTNSFSSAWLAFWAACKTRIGYATDSRRGLLNVKVPWKNAAEHLARPQAYLNLARAAGADIDLCKEWNFTLKVSSEETSRAESLLGSEEKPMVGLAPGSVAASRQWPAVRYAELADRLSGQGYQVVLLGSKADQRVAAAVVKASQSRLLDLAGKTSLREMMAILRRLRLLVSNDSGAMHLAYAQGTPVLVLQGAADLHITGPFGEDSHILRDETLACAPCVRNECQQGDLKCMLAITVEQAWSKVQTILAGKTGKNGAKTHS
jgi:heptosyltransferase-2